MNSLKTIEFFTPAKINIYLKIQNKRTDAYHDLELDLIPISLYDRIRIELTQKPGISLHCNPALDGTENNLAVKAVRLLEKEVNKKLSLRIVLEKKIPVGAGLGGGSGNAAGMLVAVNQWLGFGIPLNKLAELAQNLGSDVPFFIEPMPSIAAGTGTKLTKMGDIPNLDLLILYPKFHISTAEAYSNCQVSGEDAPEFSYDAQGLKQHHPRWNDFWSWESGQYPILQEGRELLLENGALAAGLSGSGSALFGVFDSLVSRDKAQQFLSQNTNFEIYSCQTLNQHLYLDQSE